MNHLELEWMTTTVRLKGRQEVETLGFVVDQQSLADWVRWTAGEESVGYCTDRVSPIGRCFPPAYVRTVCRQLLGKERSELPEERVPLYLCPCGDPYCGGLMVQVSRVGDRFEWSNWGSVETSLPGLPTLVFEASQYTTALSVARAFF